MNAEKSLDRILSASYLRKGGLNRLFQPVAIAFAVNPADGNRGLAHLFVERNHFQTAFADQGLKRRGSDHGQDGHLQQPPVKLQPDRDGTDTALGAHDIQFKAAAPHRGVQGFTAAAPFKLAPFLNYLRVVGQAAGILLRQAAALPLRLGEFTQRQIELQVFLLLGIEQVSHFGQIDFLQVGDNVLSGTFSEAENPLVKKPRHNQAKEPEQRRKWKEQSWCHSSFLPKKLFKTTIYCPTCSAISSGRMGGTMASSSGSDLRK